MNNVIFEKNWALRRTIGSIASFPLLLLLSIFVLMPFVWFYGSDINIFIASVGTIISEIFVILLIKKFAWGDMSWRDTLVLHNVNFKKIIFGLSCGVLCFIFMQVLAIVLINVFSVELSSSDTSQSIMDSTGVGRIFVVYLFAPFIVPIVEELLFRGIILNGLLNGATQKYKWHVLFSVVVSSFIFSIAHFQGLDNFSDIFILVWLFMLALVNSLLLIKYKSIYIPMCVHVGYNSVTTFLPLLLANI